MPWIETTIVRFVEECQPCIIECEFKDAKGQTHRVIDKCAIFTHLDLWSDSVYPVPGGVRCRVLEMRYVETGQNLALITIAEPDYLETTEGRSEFLVLESQVLKDEMGQPRRADLNTLP
jgi:hypothetical protein